MKRIITVLAVLLITISVAAQYKKASFFKKHGTTYELGSDIYMLGKQRANPLGIKFAIGTDKEGKRTFNSWDFIVVTPYSYNYTTTETDNNDQIRVHGTTSPAAVLGYNFGYYLLKNESGQKLKPFVTAGLNFVMTSYVQDETFSAGSGYNYKMETSQESIGMGCSIGAGVMFNFSKKLGLKLQGGYAKQGNIAADSYSDVEHFFLFTDHPYIGLSLRLSVNNE
jgi:hypothetical protein